MIFREPAAEYARRGPIPSAASVQRAALEALPPEQREQAWRHVPRSYRDVRTAGQADALAAALGEVIDIRCRSALFGVDWGGIRGDVAVVDHTGDAGLSLLSLAGAMRRAGAPAPVSAEVCGSDICARRARIYASRFWPGVRFDAPGDADTVIHLAGDAPARGDASLASISEAMQPGRRNIVMCYGQTGAVHTWAQALVEAGDEATVLTSFSKRRYASTSAHLELTCEVLTFSCTGCGAVPEAECEPPAPDHSIGYRLRAAGLPPAFAPVVAALKARFPNSFIGYGYAGGLLILVRPRYPLLICVGDAAPDSDFPDAGSINQVRVPPDEISLLTVDYIDEELRRRTDLLQVREELARLRAAALPGWHAAEQGSQPYNPNWRPAQVACLPSPRTDRAMAECAVQAVRSRGREVLIMPGACSSRPGIARALREVAADYPPALIKIEWGGGEMARKYFTVVADITSRAARSRVAATLAPGGRLVLFRPVDAPEEQCSFGVAPVWDTTLLRAENDALGRLRRRVANLPVPVRADASDASLDVRLLPMATYNAMARQVLDVAAGAPVALTSHFVTIHMQMQHYFSSTPCISLVNVECCGEMEADTLIVVAVYPLGRRFLRGCVQLARRRLVILSYGCRAPLPFP